jgi:Antibiotic biosynthesis monooxygenase
VVEGVERVLEVVVFKLNEGVAREQFLATDQAVSRWISEQPGFVSHELLHDADGDRWVELAWWETMEDAHTAAEKAMTSETCAPMFAMIDEESSLMLHATPAITPVRADAARPAA